MPNFDQTGPQGKGPKTGRGMGKCGNKNDVSRPQNRRNKQDNGRGLQQKDASCQKRANQ